MEFFHEEPSAGAIRTARVGVLFDGLLAALGEPKRVLLLPPDSTRSRSGAGELTVMLYERLKDQAHVEIMPALGTHVPMTADELSGMFPGVPHELFRVHDWRRGLVRLGEVPGEFVRRVSDGRVGFSVPCEVNRLVVEGGWDRIVSIGQLVPHEVAGIANHHKNVFVGVGGQETINKTHFLGAVCGMEQAMGRVRTPVRDVLDYMACHFARDLPIVYVLSVRARDAQRRLATRGLYAGDDEACFLRGAELCRRMNVDLLDVPVQKAVVYLDPVKFRSAWLGNKAIYRTRMAMADGGELVVLAPGVRCFGEDAEIDRLIRKYGYRGTVRVLQMVEENEDLAGNLSAAAHLIHGSSEGRFRITYCAGGLTREEVEGVGFAYGDVEAQMERYPPASMTPGANVLADGEHVFCVPDPAEGLWALRSRFEDSPTSGDTLCG
ncbi:MAG: DUF2088 domain-containing protein [Phycisphaerales bacterium]|nr:MAG: DUF2088 domain-containing protein [Phycisphaerales bacterium]